MSSMRYSWDQEIPRCLSDQPHVRDFPARCNKQIDHDGDHQFAGNCYGGAFRISWPREGAS